jgi:hypothetical protein
MSEKPEVSRRTALTAAGIAGVAMATAGVSAIGQEQRSEARAANAGNKKQLSMEPVRRWRSAGPFSSAEEAANFLNIDPPQGAGEASLSSSAAGQFHLIWYH